MLSLRKTIFGSWGIPAGRLRFREGVRRAALAKIPSRSCIAILIILLSSCSRANPASQGNNDLQGTVTISGAWALYPLMIRWGEAFQNVHPEVKFDISAGGAGKGMADVLAGAVDIGMVSRQIYSEEEELGAVWFSVTRDAVFLTASARNPVSDELRSKGIRRDTLVGIFIRGDVTTWGQVVDRPEVTEPIHVFTRSDAAGAPATWAEYLGEKQEDLLGIGVYGDPGILEAVINDPLGLGYNNLNYAYDFDTGMPVDGALVVPLDVNANGWVDAQEIFDTKAQAMEAVARGNYPSPPARDLNLVIKGQPTPLVRALLVWILSDGQDFVEEAGYISLPDETLVEMMAKLE